MKEQSPSFEGDCSLYEKFNQTTLQINTSGRFMSDGIYLLRIETRGKIYDLKVMKQ